MYGNKRECTKENIDWTITSIPLLLVVSLCLLFFIFPEQSKEILEKVRFFLGDSLGSYYLIVGLGFFITSLYLANSRYGDIVLGSKGDVPKYKFFTWGSMMFTCGLAADILFYSFAEWILYASDQHVLSKGNIQEWAGVYPIFHWSFIPWSFYLVLAVSFGFMLHVRKRTRRRFSEACRSILGKYVDGFIGRVIDLLSVFALLAGTATTFSIATPLMAEIVVEILGFEISRRLITIIILILTCCVYTFFLLHGFKGISFLANMCIYTFFGFLTYVLLFSGQTAYILDTGLESIGRMLQNFIGLATFTDPLRENNFPQNWTIYYWAYWMVWCVAVPFFIGNISKGRKIKEIIVGGYIFGIGSTIMSFIILGNYSMGRQLKGLNDFLGIYKQSGDLYEIIIKIIHTLPLDSLVMVIVLFTMITFYATSFDSIALTASCYSYKILEENEQPHKLIQLMWCILLILLPIALVFAESSMQHLQTVSIIAAFPLGIVMVLIVVSFFKDAGEYISKGCLLRKQ